MGSVIVGGARTDRQTAWRPKEISAAVASGARLVLTCAMKLKRRGGGTGVAALCGGGGQGDALIIIVPSDGS